MAIKLSELFKSPVVLYMAEQLIVIARQALDAAINGEDLNQKTIKIVRTAYNLGKEWLDDVVLSTSTTLDDKSLNEFFTLAENTFKEAGEVLVIDFDIPVAAAKKPATTMAKEVKAKANS